MTTLVGIEINATVSAALMVLAGMYGVDPERKQKLTDDGYDAAKVQACVNELCKLINKYDG